MVRIHLGAFAKPIRGGVWRLYYDCDFTGDAMIDFAKITKTMDGYDCHYFGQRNVFIRGDEWRVHCMAVWNPDFGSHEKWYDDRGHRLTVVGGQVVRTNNKKYRIVEVCDGN